MKRSVAPLALVCLGLAAPNAAQALSCGDVVRDDLTLKKNLDCSASETGGLVVAKNGITIDLGGKTITGGGVDQGFEGIENEGYDDVVIKNGLIKSFKDQIYFVNVAKNKVTNVTMRGGEPGTTTGIYSSYGSGNRFVGNKFLNPEIGIRLINGSENKVVGNKFKGPNRGVFTESEAFDEISRNISVGFSLTTYAFYSQSDYRTLYEDNIANGGYEGFHLVKPRRVVIRGAEANENAYAGMYVTAPAQADYAEAYSAKVVGSTANNNDEYGIYSTFGITSRRNTAVGNGYYNCHLAACNG